MKKVILTASLAILMGTVNAQQTANDYIVKTKNAKKAVVSEATVVESGQQAEEQKSEDFLSKNFKFYSLCDWKEGMKFMVMPEKYDMVVKTFHDEALNGKEVSSMTLRHKIMIYKGHTEGADGHSRINFLCQDNNKNYYYEVPSGSFDDYCYGKMGVPTLAYLGDVDIAREVLKDKTMFTKTDLFCIDTDYDSDGFQEVKLKEKNKVVTVKTIGVGTRSFPVKIIFEDEEGNEYFQNVAISKTNCGMRDDEFIDGDNAKHLFAGSFELQDAIMAVSGDIMKYEGETVYNKQTTEMISVGDGKERTLKVPRLTGFIIEKITPKRNSQYYTLMLKTIDTRRIYYKDVTFTNTDNVAGDIDGQHEDYFGYLFAMGPGKSLNTTQAARAAIRQGRVISHMTEEEVLLAMNQDPFQKEEREDGRQYWHFQRSSGIFTVVFGRDGLVEKYITPAQQKSKKASSRGKSTTAKKK